MVNNTFNGGSKISPFYFKGSNVKISYPTAEYILSKVSEYDIFKRYCSNFVEINKGFCSELRVDHNPDVFIYNTNTGKLLYRDFAHGLQLNCFQYVMHKYGVSFKDALNIIYNDLQPNFKIYEELPKVKVEKVKTFLDIIPRSYNIIDYNYWSRYGVNLTTLIEYNVIACKAINYFKGGKEHIFYDNPNDPIYAYKYVLNDETYYKIYRPYNKFKFIFNGTTDCIEGYDQLPLFGDLLIVTKSLKDCMVYFEMGIPAISLQGETNPLKQDLVNKLQKRFKKIIINLDNDEEGIRCTEKIIEQYNFPYYYIDNAKDLSDYVKFYGFEKAKELINNKLNE